MFSIQGFRFHSTITPEEEFHDRILRFVSWQLRSFGSKMGDGTQYMPYPGGHEDMLIEAIDKQYSYWNRIVEDRGARIYGYYTDGYTQADIVIFEGISQQAISKILKKYVVEVVKHPQTAPLR